MDFLVWISGFFLGMVVGVSTPEFEVTKDDWEKANKVCEVVSMTESSFKCANGTEGTLEDVK